MGNRTPTRWLPKDNGPALHLDPVLFLGLGTELQAGGQCDTLCQQSGPLSQPSGDISLLHSACLQARQGQPLFFCFSCTLMGCFDSYSELEIILTCLSTPERKLYLCGPILSIYHRPISCWKGNSFKFCPLLLSFISDLHWYAVLHQQQL